MYTIPDTNEPTQENPLLHEVAKLFDRHEDPMIRAASFNGQASIQSVEENVKMLRDRLKIIENFNKDFSEEEERVFLNIAKNMFEVRRIWKELDDEMHPVQGATPKTDA